MVKKGSSHTDENKQNNSVEKKTNRRDFLVMATSAVVCTGAIAAGIPFISSLNPDASVVASGTTEVDLTKIPVGESLTVMWRGNPVFVVHRNEKQIKEAQNVDLADLKDPEADSARVKTGYEQWLVVVAVCTHLGCVPIPNKGEYDGSLCPCHGSQYDSSGRIRKGPAPRNLEVPPYKFLNDTRILIG